MAKKLQIDAEGIISLIKSAYKVDNIKFMAEGGCEKDRQIVEMFDYVIGDLK